MKIFRMTWIAGNIWKANFIHKDIYFIATLFFDQIANQVRSINWRKPSVCPCLRFSQTINNTQVKLGEFVNIDEFFSTSAKFCDLDLDFAL